MNIVQAKKTKRIMGVDNSTQSIAYCIFNGKIPETWGEINFAGANTFERLPDIRKQMAIFAKDLEVDIVGIEKTTRVNSQQTAILLAMAAGVVISFLAEKAKVIEVSVSTWQSKTSKPSLSKLERVAFKKENPGKTASWYKNQFRIQSKQRTIDWVKNTYGVELTSNNIADAFALSAYLANTETVC
jgi:hypothetical protein